MTHRSFARFLIALTFVVIGSICWSVAAVALAQGKPAEAPTLTEVQRLTVITAAQRFEIAKLRAEAAQREFASVVQSLQVPGYTLDLATLAYTKNPDPEQPGGKDPPK